MQKYTVSLCMIVKNEEKYLDKCLSSVQGKVDEIIIVDTGSIDGTIDIAKKYNAEIRHFEWIDDFAAARNFSIEGAKSEYILLLDADEYLDEKADLQADMAMQMDFYEVMIKNYHSNGTVMYHENVRLFRNNVGLRFIGRLHEHLNIIESGMSLKRAEAKFLIHHMGYLSEVVLEKGKRERNFKLMEKELEENPEDGYAYFNMGKTYLLDNMYEEALEMFKKAYPLSRNRKYLKIMLANMAKCLRNLQRNEEGIGLLLDAIKVYPDYTEYFYTLGTLYFSEGYLRDAELAFKRCIELGEDTAKLTVEGVGSFMANYQLALIYEAKGRIGDAFDEAFRAITIKRSYTPALSLYLKLMQRAGIQQDEILGHLIKVYPIDTVEEIIALINSLYEIRHPLMNKFDFIYKNERLANLRAVALMLDNKYDQALAEWEKMETISGSNSLDAVIMCLMSKNKMLMDKVKDSLNLGTKEWKFISKVLSGENVDKPYLTPAVESLLVKMGEYLLNLKEYEQFDYINSFLLQCSADTQVKSASILLTNGYTDAAFELIYLIIDKYPRHFDSYALLGMAYVWQNRGEEALEAFSRALSLKDEFKIYESIYDLYEMAGNYPEMEKIKSVMQGKFPQSMWLQGNQA